MTTIRKKDVISRTFSFRGFYKHLSDYGENPYKPIGWIIVIVSLSTLFWLFLPILQKVVNDIFQSILQSIILFYIDFVNLPNSLKLAISSSIKVSNNNVTNKTLTITESLERSLYNMTAFRQNGTLADFIVTAFSYLILGLLFISLRRRFERKFRH